MCEALDLISMLPAGSRFLGALHPALKWDERHRDLVDIADLIRGCMWSAGMYDKDSVPEPPRARRPEDAPRVERAKKNTESRRREVEAAKEKLRSTEWSDAR